MSEPIRLFVGCAAGEDIESQQVLEFTAQQYASRELQIVWMQQQRKGFWSGWNTSTWVTPFTGFRWGIPAYCGFVGRAIYMDSDFIVRADLAELFDQDMNAAAILVRRPDGKLKTCCMLMDCAALKPHLPKLTTLMASPNQNADACTYFKARRHLLGAFDGDWNCVDLKGYEFIGDQRIKAIHYSRIETQPHLPYAIARLKEEGRKHWYSGPTGPHWRQDLIDNFRWLLNEATAAGYTVEKYRVEPVKYHKRDFTYTHSRVGATA